MKKRQLIKYFFASLISAAVSGPILTGCGPAAEDDRPSIAAEDDRPTIVVGGKNFTEQYLLSEMAAALLEEAGYNTRMRTGVSTDIARQSLVNDQIDLYYEYTGTAYTVFYDQDDPEIMGDSEKVYEWVKGKDAEKDIVWLGRVDFNNAYTLIMRQSHSEELGIETIADLAEYVRETPDELTFGIGLEFYERPDGFKKLLATYDFQPPDNKVSTMSDGLTYRALRDEQVDVAMGFDTDGRIAAFGFITLKDTQDFFPAYNPAPVIRKPVLEQHPEIREVLAPLAKHLNTDIMRQLNAEVDVEHRDSKEVAVEWLKNQGLIEMN